MVPLTDNEAVAFCPKALGYVPSGFRILHTDVVEHHDLWKIARPSWHAVLFRAG
jgi:hypothetical protein